MTSDTYYTRDRYVRDRDQSTRAGSVILLFVSSLAAILVIAGLVYAAGVGPRQQRALAFGGCEPNLVQIPSAVPCTTVWQLEKQYTSMTTSSLRQLNTDVAAYTASEFNNLGAAEAALTSEVATAKAFKTSLSQFPFSAAVAPHAKVLIQAIGAQIKLTAEQARSSSLAQLRSFNAPIDAAGVTIRTDLSLLHTALFTRPTVSQEPS
jgi:hypothetical protein